MRNGVSIVCRSVILAVVLIAPAVEFGPGAARAQDALQPPEHMPPPRNPMEAMVRQMMEALGPRDVDWRQHSQFASAATADFFASNSWTSEPDQFALQLSQEMNALPPWEVQERYDILTTRLADRYMLDAQQEEYLSQLLVRESNDMIGRFGPRLLPVVLEMAETRLNGEPFTPEQAQRWSATMAPVFEEVKVRFDRNLEEMSGILDEEQLAIVRRDYDAGQRRFARVTELGARWMNGEWDPSQWGLRNDPIQTGAVRARQEADGRTPGAPPDAEPHPAAPGAAPAQPAAGAAGAGAEAAGVQGAADRAASPANAAVGAQGPWADYVRDFIRRFGLDAAQQQRAWIIYDNGVERRDAQNRRLGERLERAGRRAGDPSAPNAALEKLTKAKQAGEQVIFDEMKRRLDRLPTRKQRRDAEAAASQPVIQRPGTPPSRP